MPPWSARALALAVSSIRMKKRRSGIEVRWGAAHKQESGGR
jgi:hypothetical protein